LAPFLPELLACERHLGLPLIDVAKPHHSLLAHYLVGSMILFRPALKVIAVFFDLS
jgi:hypothetical protein